MAGSSTDVGAAIIYTLLFMALLIPPRTIRSWRWVQTQVGRFWSDARVVWARAPVDSDAAVVARLGDAHLGDDRQVVGRRRADRLGANQGDTGRPQKVDSLVGIARRDSGRPRIRAEIREARRGEEAHLRRLRNGIQVPGNDERPPAGSGSDDRSRLDDEIRPAEVRHGKGQVTYPDDQEDPAEIGLAGLLGERDDFRPRDRELDRIATPSTSPSIGAKA